MLQMPERVETERLLLQRLRIEDAEEVFYAYASKPEATKYVSWPTHESIEDTRIYLHYASFAWNNGTDYSYSLRLKNSYKLIGSIGAMNDHGKVQFGYILSPTHWNQGYTTEACKVFVDLLLANREKIYRVWTLVDVENVSSAKVLSKCGLKEEVRLSKWMRFINQDNQPRDCILFKLFP